MPRNLLQELRSDPARRRRFAANGMSERRRRGLGAGDIFATASFDLKFEDGGNGTCVFNLRNPTAAHTFTRATTATTVLSSGLIGSVASGIPRSYYDPTTREFLGYLAEGARTNICLQSETFGDAAWTKAQATVSANSTTAPDGTTTADSLIEDNTSNVHSAAQSVTGVSGTAYCFSVFVKPNGRTFVELLIPTAIFGATKVAFFNLTTGAVGTTANSPAHTSIKAYPNGWYRCAIGDTASASAAGTPTIRIASADGTDNYQGDNASGLFLWGADFESGGIFPSTYIPTVGSTVARNADVLTYPLIPGLNTQGTAFAQLMTNWTTNAVASVAVGFGVATELPLQVATSAATTTTSARDGTNVVTKSGLTDLSTGLRKRASAWGGSTMIVTGDGVAVQSGNFDGDIGSTAIAIGSATGGAGNWFGAIRRVALWAPRFTDSQIQQVTS